MFTKLSLSLAAAFLLSAVGGASSAAPTRTPFEEAESGNPDSVDYANRTIGMRSPTNDEINAGEVGNPDSIDNKDRVGVVATAGWRAAWQALEFNQPDFG